MRALLASLSPLLLLGCAAPPPARAPAMPIVGLAPAAPTAAERERRAVAETLDAARAARIAEAAARLAAVPDPSIRLRAAEQALSALAENDPASAGALALALEAGPAQSAGLGLAARAWVARDAGAALAWAAGLAEPAAGVALREVATSGVRQSPREMLRHVEALPENSAGAEARIAVASAWAAADPDAALDWLADQRDEPRLRAAVIFAVGQVQPGRASSLLRDLPAGRERSVLVASIAQTWVAQDRGAALAWANELAVGAERDAAFAGIETGLGVPSSRRRGGGPGQRTIRSRGAGGGSGAPLRPEFSDFAAWLATQPPERNREEAMLEFVRQRGALDTGAMGQWLASLPGSPTRERALEIYLEGRLTSTPAEAAAWLRSLPRSDVNDAMVDQVARRWLRSDPDAATTWLRDLPIPEFQKDRLLREAGR